jgi:peroxiredoxin
MLQRGETAPDFTLVGAAAGDIDTHSLTEYTDNGWTVVLTFYPFDFHPACVAQWCSLRDADWLTLLEDVVVLGIGADSAYSHEQFSAVHNLQFPLLADTGGDVAEAFGVLQTEFDRHRRVPQRAIFVVGPDRTIRYCWVAEGPASTPDMDAIRVATTGHTEDEPATT